MEAVKLETPLYLQVVTVGSGSLVCRLTNGCDTVPLHVRKAFAALMLDTHTCQTRGTLGGAGKMYGISHFPGSHRYDFIAPGGLKSDTDYWFYELHGSLKHDMSEGSTTNLTMRDGDMEIPLDSVNALKAVATGQDANPIRVVSFRYFDSALERLDMV